MISPSSTQVAAACEVLALVGWRLVPPSEDRLRLLAPRHVADLLDVGLPAARRVISSLPNSCRLPGGELRAKPCDLEDWIKQHRMQA